MSLNITLNDNNYITLPGVYYPQIVKDIKKHEEPLQSLFEAFTNSLEAIELLKEKKTGKETIVIKQFLVKNLLGELEFDKIIIKDDGIGFNDKEFTRFITYKDSRKGYNNRGSGRIQLIHYFSNCNYLSSYFKNDDYEERTFRVSKDKEFLQRETIYFLKETKVSDIKSSGTTLELSNLLDPRDRDDYLFFPHELKEKIISRYIQYLCLHKNLLPKILIEQYVDNSLVRQDEIKNEDIPDIDSSRDFNLNYHRLSPDAKSTEKTERTESFKIKAFKIDKAKLKKNSIKLTSKNEVVDSKNAKIKLNCISDDDNLDGNRFLFLISGSYIDDKDDDVRGELKIPARDDFRKGIDVFNQEEILLDEIEEVANESILSMYEGIKEKEEEKRIEIEELKSMFLLNDEFLNDLKFSLNDTEETILKKVYHAESKHIAKGDSEIKKQFEELDTLNPVEDNYDVDFNRIIENLVREIPIQNRVSLTHYVARRKLTLKLFDKILKRKLVVQKNDSRNNDEQLLHNLIFKQTSETPDESDLWLLNEEFILFSGVSEKKLKDIAINGEKILKDDTELTEEQIEHKNSLGEKRDIKKPDVLLFPNEGKCIIIEFKSPQVNVSDHLNQIQNYATLIRNYSKDTFQFTTFYGYLIGEKMNTIDIRSKSPDFIEAYGFDYLYKPVTKVAGFFGRNDGNIYTEITKYSTLYERAKKRNDIFIEKLKSNSEEDLPF